VIVMGDSVTEIAQDAFEDTDNVVVCAPVGSYAQTFAEEHDLAFEGH